jgi:rare lipoprotein A
MRQIYTLLIAIATCFSCTCLHAQEEPRTDSRQKPSAKVQYGTASFYSDKFEGRKTMSDEVFHQSKMTGAHNSLPLGTWVRVTNLRNRKSVVVKINDRLHPRNPRLVDLSREAATRLGYISQGLTHVRLEVLGRNYQQVASK